MSIFADRLSPGPVDGNDACARPAASRVPLAFLPGVLLAAAIAALAFALRELPGMTTFSPLILAIVIGMAFHNIVGTPARAKPGIAFSIKRLLRIAIVLLGFQLTLTQVEDVGGRGLLIVATTLIATFLFTLWAGRALGVEQKLSQLIAAGTSICGASAVIATNAITDAHDEDVAYAVACVTIFGSIAMFTYPLLPGLLHLGQRGYGLWSGASIHEIAQVVAASFQNGQKAGEFGTMVKLARVMMLAPVVFALSIRARLSAAAAKAQSAKPPLPWFVLGFIAVVAINSAVVIPTEGKHMIVMLTTFLLSVALAAMGLETDFSKLYARGFRPAILGALAFLFIAAFSLTLIKLTGVAPS
jgi:uncharacterized integral membrane protein (TIGR00698 family)